MPGSLPDAFANFASAREVLRIVGCDPADAEGVALSDVNGEEASRAASRKGRATPPMPLSRATEL